MDYPADPRTILEMLKMSAQSPIKPALSRNQAQRKKMYRKNTPSIVRSKTNSKIVPYVSHSTSTNTKSLNRTKSIEISKKSIDLRVKVMSVGSKEENNNDQESSNNDDVRSI